MRAHGQVEVATPGRTTAHDTAHATAHAHGPVEVATPRRVIGDDATPAFGTTHAHGSGAQVARTTPTHWTFMQLQ